MTLVSNGWTVQDSQLVRVAPTGHAFSAVRMRGSRGHKGFLITIKKLNFFSSLTLWADFFVDVPVNY